jgi:ATP-dependent Lon protease
LCKKSEKGFRIVASSKLFNHFNESELSINVGGQLFLTLEIIFCAFSSLIIFSGIILKNKRQMDYDKIHTVPSIGIINGLYATTSGIGGILPIETRFIPSTQSYSIKATGSLEKIISESIDVAASVAWSNINEDLKKTYLKKWKEFPEGLHIHCPDGSTPKDGPSAGCALTLVIYSLLTNRKIRNDIAITGEINLQGKVTAIGGLEEKMEGAKKAGVKLVLYPKENNKDIIKIKERNKTLLNDDFKAIEIESFNEAMTYALE